MKEHERESKRPPESKPETPKQKSGGALYEVVKKSGANQEKPKIPLSKQQQEMPQTEPQERQQPEGGRHAYEFCIRSFAPFPRFGAVDLGVFESNLPIDYAGDARGFSTEPDASSRIAQSFQLDLSEPSPRPTEERVFSHPSHGPGWGEGSLLPSPNATAIGAARGEVTARRGDQAGTVIRAEYHGALPLVPSPDIDVYSNISIERAGEHQLNVHAVFTGDGFPSTEAFFRDQNGTALFLGLQEATQEHPIPGIVDAARSGERSISDLKFAVRIDESGNFQSVIFSDDQGRIHEVSPSTWNSWLKLNAAYDHYNNFELPRTPGGVATPVMPPEPGNQPRDAGVPGQEASTQNVVVVPPVRIRLVRP